MTVTVTGALPPVDVVVKLIVNVSNMFGVDTGMPSGIVNELGEGLNPEIETVVPAGIGLPFISFMVSTRLVVMGCTEVDVQFPVAGSTAVHTRIAGSTLFESNTRVFGVLPVSRT